MQIDLEIRWITAGRGGQELDPNLFVLLKSIHNEGSLQSAAASANISYRHAWGLLRDWGNRFGRPIAELERGRGSKLTALGEKLLSAEDEIRSRFSSDLSDAANSLNRGLQTIIHPRLRSKTLLMHASNGLAIAYLEKLCQASAEVHIDLQYHGSIEGLRSLASNHCDIAGFHFPIGKLSKSLAPMYRHWLDDNNKYKLIHVARRQQGIMTRAENPYRISRLRDLTKRSVSFVNRQRDSGTRTILDELLKQEKVKGSNIKGYINEEFTHVAVAAMVASGAADAGFGIQAAASKFGLHFIPVIEENYVIAVNTEKNPDIIPGLKKILKSKKFRDEVNGIPGYSARSAGSESTVTEFFR